MDSLMEGHVSRSARQSQPLNSLKSLLRCCECYGGPCITWSSAESAIEQPEVLVALL